MKIVIIIILFLILLAILFLVNKKYENFKNNNTLFFIHIPKNAGTSIEDVAKKHNINWGRFYSFNINDKYKKCSKWHIPPKYYENDYKNKKLFCIVRNPYTRIVSEFKYSHQGEQNKENLNKWIKSLPHEFNNNKFLNDCHLLPQTEFIKNKDDSINKEIEILRFENLNIDFKNLLNKYNYKDMKLPMNNKSKVNLTHRDLNNESKNIIKKIYKTDFETFDYPM